MLATGSGEQARQAVAPVELGVSLSGGVYVRGGKEPETVRAPTPADEAAQTRYFFALDAEGRPAWPFRHRLLPGGRVFAQRWRLGSWVYGRELDPLWQGLDDAWLEATGPAVTSWIERTLMQSYGK
jgi:hypothetical protein